MFWRIVAGVIGAVILYKIGGWLLSWARRALQGFVHGALALARASDEIRAYAIGGDYGDMEVVDEIEVDEADLDDDVLRALERHGRIAQKVSL
jgi:hypothetical protein